MTDSTLPPLPIGDRFLDESKFRFQGTGGGHRLFDCWEEAIYAYATTAVNEARTPLLAEIDRLKAQVADWREIAEQLCACHDEPTCPAVAVAREWLADPEAIDTAMKEKP